jgi:hypothetical protein
MGEEGRIAANPARTRRGGRGGKASAAAGRPPQQASQQKQSRLCGWPASLEGPGEGGHLRSR